MRSKLPRSKREKLSAYSAMAGVMFTVPSITCGQVIYRDIDDISITGDYAFIDMDDNGVDDFTFEVDLDVFDVPMAMGSGHRNGIGYTSNVFIGYQGTSFGNNYFISALDSGDNIAPAGPWLLAYPDIISYYYYPFLAFDWGALGMQGAFLDAGDKFAGVRFRADDGMHYGWLRLEVSLYPSLIVIKDLAYSADPETPIKAGQTDGCYAPSVIGTTAITAASAKLKWEAVGSADQYEVQYKMEDAAEWTSKPVYAPRTFRNIKGLDCNTNYEWKVRAVCADGFTTDFSATEFFTTGTCRYGVLQEPLTGSVSCYQNTIHIILDNAETVTADLYIYSMSGQLMYAYSFDSDETDITPDLPSGIYIVKVLTGSGSFSDKIQIIN